MHKFGFYETSFLIGFFYAVISSWIMSCWTPKVISKLQTLECVRRVCMAMRSWPRPFVEPQITSLQRYCPPAVYLQKIVARLCCFPDNLVPTLRKIGGLVGVWRIVVRNAGRTGTSSRAIASSVRLSVPLRPRKRLYRFRNSLLNTNQRK